MTAPVHWISDVTVGRLLGVLERGMRELPIGALRWSSAGLNDASVPTLQRMKTLGIGWTMQDALLFNGEQVQQLVGVDAGRRMPPITTAMRMGIPIGAGTEPHPVMSCNPFTALQSLLDAETIA